MFYGRRKSVTRWCIKLSQFNFFYNDWLDCSSLLSDSLSAFDDLQVNLTSDFFSDLKFDEQSVKNYATEAAILTSDSLGKKPAICLSGGVDSQCTVLSFYNAGLNHDVVFMKFKDGLNSHDLHYARTFCKKNNINLIEIDFDVLNFLARDNLEYAIKYDCPSPHFTCHFKFFDILQTLGYTGVVCGGTTPLQSKSAWGSNYTRNNQKYINYTNQTLFPCQGNFLSFSPKLTWAISLLTEKLDENQDTNFKFNQRAEWENIRYQFKLAGMIRAGFHIVPQITKFTGFELIKKKLEKTTGDGWAFEKLYRQPLEKVLRKTNFRQIQGSRFVFQDRVSELLNSIYSNNF